MDNIRAIFFSITIFAFHLLLRKSRKYGLRSFTKTTAEDTPTTGPGPTSGQLPLIQQPNPFYIYKENYKSHTGYETHSSIIEWSQK